MASLTSTLDIVLRDDASAPAKKVSEALKLAERQAKELASAAKEAGITDRLTASLQRLGLSASDVRAVGSAWQSYTREAALAAKATDWTKQEARNVKNWESQQVAALRNVIRERKAYKAQQQKLAADAKKHFPAAAASACCRCP